MDTESSHPPPLPSTPPHLAHQTSPGYQRLGERGESHLCGEVGVGERGREVKRGRREGSRKGGWEGRREGGGGKEDRRKGIEVGVVRVGVAI